MWLVPIAIGSASVGSLYGTQAASAATTGQLEVCKAASNGMAAFSFTFTVDGTPLAHAIQGGTCSAPLTLSAGNHHVVETAQTGFVVAGITATPSTALIGKNPANRSATVAVTAGAETIVKFFNKIPPAQLKVCKQADADSPLLVGKVFTFTENGGTPFSITAGAFGSPQCSGLTTYPAGTIVTVAEAAFPNAHVSGIDVTQPPATNVSKDLSARTVTLTVGSGVNVVTYTNEQNVANPKGFVEICKDASDQFVTGSFSFTIVDSSGKSTGPLSVAVGQCSGPIQVPSGPATISEASRFPYFLDDVWTNPDNRLISENDSNGTATVSVVAGDTSTETQVHFVNNTLEGQVKVCKTLSSNSSALVGQPFTFSWTGPNSSGTVTIVAAPLGQAACTILNGPLFGNFPLGSNVSITEASQANVQITSVTVSPASQDNGSAPPTANLTVGSGITIATFNNEAMGTLEICKIADDPQTVGVPFQFSVNGGPSITVNAGQCSPNISVPAGTATVSESSSTNFHLVAVTATGPLGENRLLSPACGPEPNEDCTGANPATVSVPFGGVGNETLVSFTNEVNTGQFKICKTTTATSDGSGILLGGQTFNYSYNYVVDGTTYGGSASLTLPSNGQPGVTVCTGLFDTQSNDDGIPVVNSNGSEVTVYISEQQITGVHVLSITYQGNGDDFIAIPSNGNSQFDIGQGVNIVTYDNEPNPPGTARN